MRARRVAGGEVGAEARPHDRVVKVLAWTLPHASWGALASREMQQEQQSEANAKAEVKRGSQCNTEQSELLEAQRWKNTTENTEKEPRWTEETLLRQSGEEQQLPGHARQAIPALSDAELI